jgi:hypothetical protein
VNRLHAGFEAEGWTVEELSRDYGEDLLVRLFEDESATPYSFFVQAKSTDRIEKYHREQSDAYLFPIETGHLRHWVRFAEPVFLTLYDSPSGQTFWVSTQCAAAQMAISEKVYKQRTVSIAVPCCNVLDPDGILRIRGITRLRFERIDRERRGARLLIDLQATAPGFKVSHYDPANELIEIDTDSGHEFIFLGAAGERMREILKDTGVPPEEFLYKAAKAYLEAPQTADSRARARQLLQEIRKNKERQAGRRSLLS